MCVGAALLNQEFAKKMLDPNTFLFMLLLRQVFYNECDAVIKFVIQCKDF